MCMGGAEKEENLVSGSKYKIISEKAPAILEDFIERVGDMHLKIYIKNRTHGEPFKWNKKNFT